MLDTYKPNAGIKKAATVLIDLSVIRHAVLSQETWVEKTIRWANRDVVTRIAGWKPKTPPTGLWLRQQIGCLPTICRLAREGAIVLYTYSELEFEEWQGRRGMQGTFGDLFSGIRIRKCPAAVNRLRFRRNVDFQYYLKREEVIDFCRFLLKLDPLVLRQAHEVWSTLPAFEQETLLHLQQFKSLCRHLPEKHYPDAFHLWTAEANRLDYFLMLDRKFPNALKGKRDLGFRCRPVSPDELLNSMGISERDPYPYTDSAPRTYSE